ncbi:MAG: DUF4430 domain-containing protein [Clostridia bacterium]|nr:DUF4430 domain-containing protein [Clostridia bacterium]
MKKLRLISLLMAVVLVTMGLISCGGEVVSAKVRLAVIKVNANGSKDLICGVMESEIKGTANNPPTVLQAAREILEENSIQYTIDESTGGFTSIKNQKERSANGVVSGWIYKLNGQDSTELANVAVVKDGDYIVYYLTSWTNEDAVDDPDVTEDENETEPETEEVEEEEETEDQG